MSSKSFEVDVTREGGYWVGVVRGLRGGATEVRRLAELDVEVRDLISGLLDLDPDEILLTWHYDNALPAIAAQRVSRWHKAQQTLEEARTAYERAQHEVVEALVQAGVSVRDAAALTGLSFQRVQQLRNAPGKLTSRKIAAKAAQARGSGRRRAAATVTGKKAAAVRRAGSARRMAMPAQGAVKKAGK